MPKNPFKFLDSFEKKDIDRFFGRTKETAQLFNAVHASNLVMIYGASGTGKTSLVMCGLANKFHDTDWLPVFIRRGSDINASIQRELKVQLPDHISSKHGIRELIHELYLEHYKPVYLIFDQFEELYILGNEKEQNAFHQEIGDLLKSELNCKILIIFREEYLASLSEFEKVVPSLFDNRLRIEKMNRLNLRKVILGTARWGKIEVVEPKKTIPAIFDNLFVKREGIDLTNLQVYLDHLWRKDAERQGASTDEEILKLEKITYDLPLVDSVGAMQYVISEFIDHKLKDIETALAKQDNTNIVAGLPLEILFTMVTEDGTKRSMDKKSILKYVPKYFNLSEKVLDYCLKEFKRLRLLRELVDAE